MTETKNVTLSRMANINEAREFGFATMFANLPLITAAADKIGMARANMVIVAWESGEWADVQSPADESKRAFADWAAFCKAGMGISPESQISGAARKHIVRTLRDRTDNLRAEVADMAAATGANVRTIARDVKELGLADAEKSEAGKAAQASAGNTGDGSATTITADLPKLIKSDKGVKSVDLGAIVTYLTTQVDVAELAGLLGAEFVAKLHAAATTPDARDAA